MKNINISQQKKFLYRVSEKRIIGSNKNRPKLLHRDKRLHGYRNNSSGEVSFAERAKHHEWTNALIINYGHGVGESGHKHTPLIFHVTNFKPSQNIW